jgi:uncharacterized membrane protein
MQLIISCCIDKPVSEVWQRLAEIDKVHVWATETIADSRCFSGSNNDSQFGVGSERVCTMKTGRVLKERVLNWEENQGIEFDVKGFPLFKAARNHWKVQAAGEHKTLLSSTITLDSGGGTKGWLLETFLSWPTRMTFRRTLSRFKYYIENDRPYEGSFMRLPIGNESC